MILICTNICKYILRQSDIALVVLLEYLTNDHVVDVILQILIGAHLLTYRAEFLPLVLLIPQGVDAVIRASTSTYVR